MVWRDPWQDVDRGNALRMQGDAQNINMLTALQGAQTNALQQRQMRTAMDDETAIRDAYRMSAGDPAKLREALTGRGAYKQIQSLDAADLARRGAEAKISRDTAEGDIKRAQLIRDSIAQVTDQQGWDALRASMGERAARFPAQYDPRVIGTLAMQASDYVKRMTPDIKQVDIGGSIIAQDMNPFTNPNITGAQMAKTNTPDAVMTDRRTRDEGAANRGVTMRGQNMTDARSRETLAQGRLAYDAERGGVVNLNSQEFRPAMQGGQPIGPKDKDLTDAQSKAYLFGDRMQKADAIISGLAKKGTTTSIPGSQMGFGVGATINAVSSGNQQSLDQAKRDFINAVLRRESGAVISPAEFENAEKQYFPQVGDSQQVMKQKAQNRMTAQEGIMMEVPQRKRPKQQTATEALSPQEQEELTRLRVLIQQRGG
jgi:hypothetical protein